MCTLARAYILYAMKKERLMVCQTNMETENDEIVGNVLLLCNR